MAEDGMPLSEWGLEDEDNEPARGPAVGGQSSAASPAPSTAQVPTRPLMPREPMGIEEAALLRRCLRRWYYSPWIRVHQEYRVSYEDLVMEHSRQLGVHERTYRIVDWARLYGVGERQQPQGREWHPTWSGHPVGPSRRCAICGSGWPKQVVRSGPASSRFAESPGEGRQQPRPR